MYVFQSDSTLYRAATYTSDMAIVKNLNICQYFDFDSIIENVKDPTLKAIFKLHKTP